MPHIVTMALSHPLPARKLCESYTRLSLRWRISQRISQQRSSMLLF
jgi:hypothetical protein